MDYSSPSLLPLVISSLSASALGIRVAACRLVKSLSRSVRILRTSLIDAGVAEKLLHILKNKNELEDMKIEALDAISNLVMKFSPMKTYLLENGAIEKLVAFSRGEEETQSSKELGGSKSLVEHHSLGSIGMKVTNASTKYHALWAIRNLLYGSEIDLKQKVMNGLGWEYVAGLALSADDQVNSDVRTQALALGIMRNLMELKEADIDYALNGFGRERLLDLIENVIWQERDVEVIVEIAFILANLATGNEEQRRLILDRANLLDALLYFLVSSDPPVRFEL